MQDQNHFFESEDHTMEFDTQDAQDAKIWSVLAYFGILFFLPLVAVPNSAYGKFHASQGLILLIFYVTLTVASWLVRPGGPFFCVQPFVYPYFHRAGNSFRFGSVGSISLYHCVDCVWYGAGCTGQGKDVASDWEVSPDWMTGNRVCGSVAS